MWISFYTRSLFAIKLDQVDKALLDPEVKVSSSSLDHTRGDEHPIPKSRSRKISVVYASTSITAGIQRDGRPSTVGNLSHGGYGGA